MRRDGRSPDFDCPTLGHGEFKEGRAMGMEGMTSGQEVGRGSGVPCLQIYSITCDSVSLRREASSW